MDQFEKRFRSKIPGTPWAEKDELIFNPKLNGLFYWLIRGNAHMSRSTLGEESTVTITFSKQGDETKMTLLHTDLPDREWARGHEGGWNYFLDGFTKTSSKKRRGR